MCFFFSCLFLLVFSLFSFFLYFSKTLFFHHFHFWWNTTSVLRLSATLPSFCFSCRHVVLLERRFSLVTTSFAQPLPCGNVHWSRLLCFSAHSCFNCSLSEVFGVSAQVLSCFQTLCNHCPRPCVCCMAPVTWKCGSFSLAVTCTFDRGLDTEIRVLSTAQSRNRTSTESDKYSQILFMFLLRSFFGWCCCLPFFFSVWCCLPSPALGGVFFLPVFCCVVPLGLFLLWVVLLFFLLLFGGVVFLLLWVGLLFPLSSVGWCCLVSSSFFQSCCSFPFSCSVVLPSFASFGWGSVHPLFCSVVLLGFLLLWVVLRFSSPFAWCCLHFVLYLTVCTIQAGRCDAYDGNYLSQWFPVPSEPRVRVQVYVTRTCSAGSVSLDSERSKWDSVALMSAGTFNQRLPVHSGWCMRGDVLLMRKFTRDWRKTDQYRTLSLSAHVFFIAFLCPAWTCTDHVLHFVEWVQFFSVWHLCNSCGLASSVVSRKRTFASHKLLTW